MRSAKRNALTLLPLGGDCGLIDPRLTETRPRNFAAAGDGTQAFLGSLWCLFYLNATSPRDGDASLAILPYHGARDLIHSVHVVTRATTLTVFRSATPATDVTLPACAARSASRHD